MTSYKKTVTVNDLPFTVTAERVVDPQDKVRYTLRLMGGAVGHKTEVAKATQEPCYDWLVGDYAQREALMMLKSAVYLAVGRNPEIHVYVPKGTFWSVPISTSVEVSAL